MNHDIDLDRPWTGEYSETVSRLDVYYFFRHILGRLPTEPEWPGHCGFVGKKLADVVGTYLNAPEFKDRGLVGFSPCGIVRVDLDGYVMYAAENDVLVGQHILATGGYEPEVTAVFKSFLRPGMTVIDIGASIGWFTFLSAALVGPEGRVFAIEPGAENGRFLLAGKWANGFEQIDLIHAAASDRIESLIYSSSLSNGFVRELRNTPAERMFGADIVAGIPIDLLVPEDRPVHLLKADAEGWEMKALRGAQGIIERWRPRIICEFTPPALVNACGVTGEEFLAPFAAWGYSFEVIRAEGLLPCGTDIGAVMAVYERGKRDHLDILMIPPVTDRR